MRLEVESLDYCSCHSIRNVQSNDASCRILYIPLNFCIAIWTSILSFHLFSFTTFPNLMRDQKGAENCFLRSSFIHSSSQTNEIFLTKRLLHQTTWIDECLWFRVSVGTRVQYAVCIAGCCFLGTCYNHLNLNSRLDRGPMELFEKRAPKGFPSRMQIVVNILLFLYWIIWNRTIIITFTGSLQIEIDSFYHQQQQKQATNIEEISFFSAHKSWLVGTKMRDAHSKLSLVSILLGCLK